MSISGTAVKGPEQGGACQNLPFAVGIAQGKLNLNLLAVAVGVLEYGADRVEIGFLGNFGQVISVGIVDLVHGSFFNDELELLGGLLHNGRLNCGQIQISEADRT